MWLALNHNIWDICHRGIIDQLTNHFKKRYWHARLWRAEMQILYLPAGCTVNLGRPKWYRTTHSLLPYRYRYFCNVNPLVITKNNDVIFYVTDRRFVLKLVCPYRGSNWPTSFGFRTRPPRRRGAPPVPRTKKRRRRRSSRKKGRFPAKNSVNWSTT